MRFVTKCFLILLLALTSGWVGAASPVSTEALSYPISRYRSLRARRLSALCEG